jgi:glycerate 2-kinase
VTRGVGAREAARRVFEAALAVVDTRARTARVELPEADLDVLAVGKAATAMARGILDRLPDARGLVVTKDGHGADLGAGMEVREAAHPVPDARSLAAGEELLARARAARGALVVAISGGASALAVAPAEGLSFADKVAAARAVAASGAGIRELNCVRKHLSRIKGGRLAAAAPAGVPVLGLILSDVVGDDAATVGGGLVSPDSTTLADALAVAEAAARVPGIPPMPPAVLAFLRGGAAETPKALPGARTELIAGPDTLLDAAVAAAEELGEVAGVWRRVTVTVEELAARLVAEARALAAATRPGSDRPRFFLAGGEPTVRIAVAAPGRGGRAQHTGLFLARALSGVSEVAVLAVGSDGSDGPTGDAGALVDGATWARAGDGARALRDFDSGTALAAAGDLVTTGPTGTNLCDLYVVCVSR